MKLRETSTQPRIFEGSEYEHPWYKHTKYRIADDCPEDMKEHAYKVLLNKPKPPSSEAVAKAQFKDKTYTWKKPST